MTSLTHAVGSFASLGVPASIDAVLQRQSITEPFPIQAATLPDALAGRNVLARGRTGSGKTIAFAIPTVLAVAASDQRRQPGHPRALILVPTRELATQVAAVVAPIAKAVSLTCATVFGGVPQGRQVAALRAGVDIVIACPGRLEDLIEQRQCRLDRVLVTVLDEADHMADLGFLPAVKRLLDQTPANGQRLLFSATLDGGVDAIVRRYVGNPVTHVVEPEPESEATMVHHVLSIAAADKFAVIRDVVAGNQRVLLFTRTKHGARKLARQLTMAGLPAGELHGNMAQGARQRSLDAFTRGEVRALVATDIAARGIHVDEIALVVHVDPPAEHKAYLHRSGRTARAGAEGVVATVMTPDQADDVRRLMRLAKVAPTTTRVSPGHPLLPTLSTSEPGLAFVAPRQYAPSPVERTARSGDRPSAGRERPSGPNHRPRSAHRGRRSAAGPRRIAG